MRVLFVTWDGPDQSYLDSLFLPIFAGLRAHGVETRVLSYTYGARGSETGLAASIDGVDIVRRAIQRRPTVALGSLLTIAAGARDVVEQARSWHADVLMPRSILPGAMVLAARHALPQVKIHFEADGLMADERVELAGLPARGPVYRALLGIERLLLEAADSVTTRTHAAKSILLERARGGIEEERVHVVANGVDPSRFRRRSPEDVRVIRERWAIPPGAPWVIYCGSIGPQYLPEASLALFERLRARIPEARLTILTGQPALAEEGARRACLPVDSYRIARVDPPEVAEVLGAADLGLALRKPTFSQRAVSPIKVAEYLLSGLPMITTPGVGDLDALLDDPSVAHRIDPASPNLDEAVRWFLDEVSSDPGAARVRSRAIGEREFTLDRAVRGFARALGWGTQARIRVQR